MSTGGPDAAAGAPGGPRAAAASVLVVGAGPVGLTAAHELARRGVRVRVVDRAPGPAVTSRALAVHARTLEVLDQMTVLDTLLLRGRRVEHFSVHLRGRTLVRFDTDYSEMPTRFPFSLMVDQVVTERVLRERLSGLGVEVEWGVGLDDFTPHEDRVDVVLSTRQGPAEHLGVPWLVGADGARSTVRKRLGLRLVGDAAQTWLNADVRMDARLPGDSNHLLHTGKGTLLLVPFPEQGKWRVVDTQDVDGAEDPEKVRARLEQKVSAALARPVAVSEPSWISVFTVQQRMIAQMRVGRCFVAGDAAHVHSPASGQGMNAGIQDAYNLAWKLADVVRGHAGDGLLDSYSAERVPIGERLLGSTRVATALVALRNALGPYLLPVALGLVRNTRPVKARLERKMIRSFCGLTVSYAGSPLSPPPAGPSPGPGAGRGPRPGERVGFTAEDLAGHAGWREMCEELRSPRWTLLARADGDGAPDLVEEIGRAYGEAVSVRDVTGSASGRAGRRALPDPGGALSRGLGLVPGEFALIRPDGYLAARGPFTDRDRVTGVLGRLGLLARPLPAPGASPAAGASPASPVPRAAPHRT